MPLTMAPAPNRMKQPMITVAPKRQFMRPVSIMKPTIATAITATAVATLPSSVPCIHRSALTIGPEPAGFTAWAAAADGTLSAIIGRAARPRAIFIGFLPWRRLRFDAQSTPRNFWFRQLRGCRRHFSPGLPRRYRRLAPFRRRRRTDQAAGEDIA